MHDMLVAVLFFGMLLLPCVAAAIQPSDAEPERPVAVQRRRYTPVAVEPVLRAAEPDQPERFLFMKEESLARRW